MQGDPVRPQVVTEKVFQIMLIETPPDLKKTCWQKVAFQMCERGLSLSRPSKVNSKLANLEKSIMEQMLFCRPLP